MPLMNLGEFVNSFAVGMKTADTQGPVAVGARSREPYLPGIGPHSESETITLAIEHGPFARLRSSGYARREVSYPSVARTKCDIVVDEGPDSWAIEVKMLRMMGNNGRVNDNLMTHILSPYPRQHSAVTDCTKLLRSGFEGHKAIVIFGYDYLDYPMRPAIDAFELLASQRVKLTPTEVSHIEDLIHPVHSKGAVYGWEIRPR